MNPESPPRAGSVISGESPIAASAATLPRPAPDGAVAAASGDDAQVSAARAQNDPLLALPQGQPTALSDALPELQAAREIPERVPPGTSPQAPELSPAACGARLAALFPALFVAPAAPGPDKPIKLRIHTDIQARAPSMFSKRVLGIYFSRYTTSNAYLRALTLAPHRFDLDGQPAGEISDEHRRLAAEELERRHALAAERRAAQRPPRRAAPRADGLAPAVNAQADRRPDRQTAARPPMQAPISDERPEQTAGRAAPPSRRGARPARPPRHSDRVPHAARSEPFQPAPQPPRTGAAAAQPVDPAQRERSMLLRSYESSPLSKGNFCALKGITETALDEVLAQAKAEHRAPPPILPRRRGGAS